jgi:hypothetical protein
MKMKRAVIRHALLVTLFMSFASLVFAGSGNVQPLNVKTGLWQTTMTITLSGAPPMTPEMQAHLAQMSPEQRARIEAMMKQKFGGTPETHTYQSCITKEDLNKYPFTDPKQNCTYNVLTSTGSKMDVSGTCTQSDGTKANFNMRLDAVDSENVKGTGQLVLSGNGRTTNGNYSGTGKWLSSSCAGMK